MNSLLSTNLHAQIQYYMSLRQNAISNKIKFCEQGTLVSYNDIKEKDSASSCILRIGIWQPHGLSKQIRVAIKMIPYQDIYKTRLKKGKSISKSRADELTRLDIHAMRNEIYIYLMVIHELLRTFSTPCLITMYSHLIQNRNQDGSLAKTKYIALEHQQYTLKKYIEMFPETISNVITPGFIFMLVYTLACFQLYGLQHNDLHISNYFIELYSPPIPEIIFRINETDAVILKDVAYVPKIYDYDRSALFKTDFSFRAEQKHQQRQSSSSNASSAHPSTMTAEPILPLLFSDPIHKTKESVSREKLFHLINNTLNLNWDLAVLLIGFVRLAEIHYTRTNPANSVADLK